MSENARSKRTLTRLGVVALLLMLVGGLVYVLESPFASGTAQQSPQDQLNYPISISDLTGDEEQVIAEELKRQALGEQNIIVTDGVKHLVPLEKIHSGGPPKDGIASIDNPNFLTAEQGNQFLEDQDLVLGLFLEGKARAYPHRILVWHEIVNDKFGGIPVVVTYCPLCFTGVAYERILGGDEVEFGVSGLLYNSDLVMYDRKTDTLWSQITGQAIVGELTGMKLKRINLETITWGDWKKLHPDTQVLSTDTGFVRDYGSSPYTGYEVSSNILFPVDNTDSRLHNKEIVYGVEFGGIAKAYPMKSVRTAGLVNDLVGGRSILVLYDTEANVVRIFDRESDGQILEFELSEGKVIDRQTQTVWNSDGEAVSGALKGKALDLLVAPSHFWFAWVAFNPQTDLFESNSNTTN